jgi:hypothetical protein
MNPLPLSSLLQGFVVAAVAPALVAGIVYGRADLAATVGLWSAVHAFALGLPLCLVLRKQDRVGWLTSAACGAVVGALPLGVLLFPGWSSESAATTWVNGELMAMNGVATAAAWASYAALLARLAALGLFCGLVFYAFVRLGRKHAT